MRKIIYYVATSLDGYIAGKNDDVSQFLMDGEGVERYQNELLEMDTVIMGRNTYEFGYSYGILPGQPVYPHMEHYVFSNNLTFENIHPKVHVEELKIERVKELKAQPGRSIYLCGGGQFAGWLAENGLIDELRLKLNPILLGEGTKLFKEPFQQSTLTLIDQTSYQDGLQLLSYSFHKG